MMIHKGLSAAEIFLQLSLFSEENADYSLSQDVMLNISNNQCNTIDQDQALNESCYPFLLPVIILILSTLLKYQRSRTSDEGLTLIPSPRWYIPYLGSLTFIGRRWFDSLANIRKKYGDVYMLRVGSRPVVVLNGYRTIHQALVGGGDDSFENQEQSRQRARSFSGRPNLHSFQLASRGRSMSFNSYSDHWKQHRRLAERAMREMNENETFWKNVVCKEATGLRDSFLSKVDKGPFNPNEEVLWSVARIKYGLCYGGADADKQASNDLESVNTTSKGEQANKCSSSNCNQDNGQPEKGSVNSLHTEGEVVETAKTEEKNSESQNISYKTQYDTSLNSLSDQKEASATVGVQYSSNEVIQLEILSNSAKPTEQCTETNENKNHSSDEESNQTNARPSGWFHWKIVVNKFVNIFYNLTSKGEYVESSFDFPGIKRTDCRLIGNRKSCSVRSIGSPSPTRDDPTSERNDEQDFKDMINHTMRLIDCNSKGNLVDFFPWARCLITSQLHSLEELCAQMLSITERKHRQHLSSYKSEVVRDLQDALIKHGLRNKRCSITDSDQIMMTVQEYIGAGLDIIQASMMWILLYLVNHPQIQARIQDEIEAVIGKDRAPCMLDVSRLPYTEAFVLEVLRHASVVPLALPHSTINDTNINGIAIPRDTFIMVNLHSVNHDQQLWNDPEEFRPERYLTELDRDSPESEESNFVTMRRRKSVQWGMGRRRCLGEEFSKAELVIYVSTLLQSCRLHRSRDAFGSESYSIEPKLGVVLKPRDFNIVVSSR